MRLVAGQLNASRAGRGAIKCSPARLPKPMASTSIASTRRSRDGTIRSSGPRDRVVRRCAGRSATASTARGGPAEAPADTWRFPLEGTPRTRSAAQERQEGTAPGGKDYFRRLQEPCQYGDTIFSSTTGNQEELDDEKGRPVGVISISSGHSSSTARPNGPRGGSVLARRLTLTSTLYGLRSGPPRMLILRAQSEACS